MNWQRSAATSARKACRSGASATRAAPWAKAAKVFRGDYRTRYVYHAQMEPLNATADGRARRQSVEIWAGTQEADGLPRAGRPPPSTSTAAKSRCTSISWAAATAGAARREVVLDAVPPVESSRQAGEARSGSREDDIAGGKFRPMTAHHIEAGFDAAGKLVAWHHRVVSKSAVAYMAASAGSPPPKQDLIVMKGSPVPEYPTANKLAEHVVVPGKARLSPWRGIGNGHNAFAAESFLDEIAAAEGKDPIAFRLALSEGVPRAQHLLRTVAAMSDWTKPREGRALGVSFMEKDETLSAGVAEVSVNRETGKIKVHNFWVAIDAGIAVQPRNLAAQTEGSIVYGLGHVLREKITIRDGRVLSRTSTTTRWRGCRMSPTSRSRWCRPTIRRPVPARTGSRSSPAPSATPSPSSPACACANCRSHPSASAARCGA